VRPDLQRCATRRLDALDAATSVDALRQPGFDCHALRGTPRSHSIHVNGPWCITVEWRYGKALRVDLSNTIEGEGNDRRPQHRVPGRPLVLGPASETLPEIGHWLAAGKRARSTLFRRWLGTRESC
jgi:proteic killer suppression protein